MATPYGDETRVISVTADTFESEVRREIRPVLVDFWGPRCAPCLALMPFVEELAGQEQERLKIVKVNAVENRKLCAQLRVLGLPTFLIFVNGQELARRSGDVSAGDLRRWIQEQLAGLASTVEAQGEMNE